MRQLPLLCVLAACSSAPASRTPDIPARFGLAPVETDRCGTVAQSLAETEDATGFLYPATHGGYSKDRGIESGKHALRECRKAASEFARSGASREVVIGFSALACLSEKRAAQVEGEPTHPGPTGPEYTAYARLARQRLLNLGGQWNCERPDVAGAAVCFQRMYEKLGDCQEGLTPVLAVQEYEQKGCGRQVPRSEVDAAIVSMGLSDAVSQYCGGAAQRMQEAILTLKREAACRDVPPDVADELDRQREAARIQLEGCARSVTSRR
jgi:hypothetical protein